MDAITAFLDAADEVLNSNTFLVSVPQTTGDILADTREFIASGRLQRALLHEDLARGWCMLHRLNAEGDPIPIPENLAKPVFQLTVRPSPYRPGEYLRGMLCADGRFRNFFSFYGRWKTLAEAQALTECLLAQLFPDVEPTLLILEPDFLVGATEGVDQLYYFEGTGCDNAALLVSGPIAYLILSNGTP